MSRSLKPPIVLIGGGGHAAVLAEILLMQNREIVAVLSPEEIQERAIFRGMVHLKEDSDVLTFNKEQVRLVNGIGMLPKSMLRKRVNEYFLELGYQFDSVIADSAYVSPSALIEEGAQILPMAIVHTGAHVGKHSIVNTSALIEHDCKIGEYNHIAPKSVLCGQVETERDVFIGAGSVLTQNVKVGQSTLIGAGAIVNKIIEPNSIVYPAKGTLKQQEHGS
ncbi:NeuD/PglB/VioB family sugar acetyltransferase [Marinomonas ostreistagni]|uniref:NeuD/PglB/VioB family sugar acetyltransferase n=1 Tax=Marinomonas ostreistagni TaxID=359209 RepID=UPI0019509667|nr:acetyltransferase [Marinomonas ostreistagni]